MSTIYIKIHEYKKDLDTLIVSFASNETASSNPSDYPSVAIQPSIQFPGIVEIGELHLKLADIGKNITLQQKIKEDIQSGKLKTEIFESLVTTEVIAIDIAD
jgi:hypothetical protein